MEFEFDEVKSRENKLKHGISFSSAQAMWLDPMLIMGPANSQNEERYVVVASIQNTIWAAIITFRGSKIRIISARRARSEEVQVYEDQ